MRVFVDGSSSSRYDQASKIAIVAESTGKPSRKIVKETEERLTNNQAEYQALLEALSLPDVKDCTIYTDSRLLHGQLTLDWKVRRSHLKEPRARCVTLLREKNCKLEWIPRERNLAGKLLEKTWQVSMHTC